MIKIGDHVRIHRDGTSVFVVTAIDEEEGRGLIEALDDAPGKYAFTSSLASLVPVDDSAGDLE